MKVKIMKWIEIKITAATFKDFFNNNSDQIWTLISVFVGGVMTYISTHIIETQKNKSQSKKDNLDRTLIPFCTCLENTINAIENLKNTERKLFQRIFEEVIETIKSPITYLKAEKRIFLSKPLREKLQKYNEDVLTFISVLDQECKKCCSAYNSYIESKLKRFPHIETFMYTITTLSYESDTKIINAIINKKELSLINEISDICFVQSDDPEYKQEVDIDLSEEVRKLNGAINYGVIEETDIDTQEALLSCTLLEFISDNTSDEKAFLKAFIDKTRSNQNLQILYAGLNEMHKTVIKMIDKITL